MPVGTYTSLCMELQKRYIFCGHVCLCNTYTQGPQGPEEGIGSPETRVMDGCEPHGWFWELNQGPLQEQVFLTTEQSLKLPYVPLKKKWPRGI